MRKASLLVLALLFHFYALCAQEMKENPSMLEICQYLDKNPQGPLADAYSDLLALYSAQAFGPDSTEEDYRNALSTARSENTQAQIREIWQSLQQARRYDTGVTIKKHLQAVIHGLPVTFFHPDIESYNPRLSLNIFLQCLMYVRFSSIKRKTAPLKAITGTEEKAFVHGVPGVSDVEVLCN